MNTSVDEFRELILDDQRFVLPGDNVWGDIMETGSWNGLPVFYPRTKHIVEEMLRFARQHERVFSLGLCTYGPLAKSWTAMMLFKPDTSPQRVHIEHVRCETCGAMQVTANPSVAELFLGVDAQNEVFARSLQAKRVQCIQCAGELPRPAVWTELLSNEGTT